MGCITSVDVKNPKKNKNKDNHKHIQPQLYKSRLDKSTVSKVLTPRGEQLPPLQKVDYPTAPKILQTSSIQFLSNYEITQTLQESTRLQGPKLLTNKIHGGVNVLRVYQSDRINQQRLKKYHQILKFQLFTDEQENYLLIDQYCSGPSIGELFTNQLNESNHRQLSQEQIRQHRQQIHNILIQVHEIISKFHTNKTYLGGLNIFSFKKITDFTQEIKLVDFNFCNPQQTDRNYSMGHGHHNSFQADWEFFGYLVQFFYSNKSPVFITHKMQYVESSQQQQQVQFQLISNMLKGRQVIKTQVESLPVQRIKYQNEDVLNGYRFCRDVIKLIKSRKRRMKHKACYYSVQVKKYYHRRNNRESQEEQQQLWNLQNCYDNTLLEFALSEDNLHKLETERIFKQIQKYIENLNSQCEEHMINYSTAGESFRKLKEIFLITDKRKKMQELKDSISQIK